MGSNQMERVPRSFLPTMSLLQLWLGRSRILMSWPSRWTCGTEAVLFPACRATWRATFGRLWPWIIRQQLIPKPSENICRNWNFTKMAKFLVGHDLSCSFTNTELKKSDLFWSGFSQWHESCHLSKVLFPTSPSLNLEVQFVILFTGSPFHISKVLPFRLLHNDVIWSNLWKRNNSAALWKLLYL